MDGKRRKHTLLAGENGALGRLYGDLSGKNVLRQSTSNGENIPPATTRAEASRRIVRTCHRFLILIFFVLLLAGCRTVAPLPPVNFQQGNWHMQHGQAVWRPKRDSAEIAGDIVLAARPGRTVLEFTKTPFPIAVAQTTPSTWQIEFPPENRFYSGRGTPPSRLSWLHLANALAGTMPPEPWKFARGTDGDWQLENEKTGESIAGFLTP